MVNAEIKKYAAVNKVKQWKVAEHLGLSESALSRKLRHELSPKEKEEFIAAVDQVKNEGAVNG